MTNDHKVLVDVHEMAEILNVPVSWLYQRTRKGQEGIPHMRVGKYIRFIPQTVFDFITEKGGKI